MLKYFADSGIIETLTVKQIKKHRIGAHFFKLNTDKPYFNLLCCFEWFQNQKDVCFHLSRVLELCCFEWFQNNRIKFS
ncbi:hypothetical protein D3853_04050 [Streptococcus mutans]|nr:hypothetical protein [Streptococcus mutans]